MAVEEFAGVLPAIGKVAGSVLGNLWNFSNQSALNKEQAELSFQNQSRLMHKSDQLNRAYAHDQYSIFRDSLRKANMNPYVMSGAQPAGSNLQAGSGASGSSSPQADFGDMGFQASLGSKLATQRQQQELQNMEAEEELTKAKTAKIKGVDTDEATSRTELNKSQSSLNQAQLAKVASAIGVDEATIKKLEAETLYLGKSELTKHLGDNPSVGDIADYLSKRIPDIAKDVVIGVASILLPFGVGKTILGKLFSLGAGKISSIFKAGSIKNVANAILKDKDLLGNVSKSELSELEKAVAKRFGSDILK